MTAKGSENLVRIPTVMLRKGLYVGRLDRPWTDLPVRFQGLEIRTDAQLAMLRRYCRHVYVEPERTEADERVVLPTSEDRTCPTDIADKVGRVRHPGGHAFAADVQKAARHRAAASRFFEQALAEARLGGRVNTRNARPVIEELCAGIAANGSAAMWLTSLRDRDELDATHSVNVCVLAVILASHLRLPAEQIEEIGLGALLHDIGKVQIPRRIAHKAGPLTEEEAAVVRRHPWVGYQLLSTNRDVTRWACDAIWMHHENVDGSGYPRGLTGDEIPTHARLVAVANAYESLTSARPHRPAMPPDKALAHLFRKAPRTHGLDAVQALISCVGIYPIGSLVELDNGALGLVIGSSPESRLWPTVLLVRTPDGVLYDRRLLLNLAADDRNAAEDGAGGGRHVRRVLDPADHGIDVPGIVAFEFGMKHAGEDAGGLPALTAEHVVMGSGGESLTTDG